MGADEHGMTAEQREKYIAEAPTWAEIDVRALLGHVIGTFIGIDPTDRDNQRWPLVWASVDAVMRKAHQAKDDLRTRLQDQQ